MDPTISIRLITSMLLVSSFSWRINRSEAATPSIARHWPELRARSISDSLCKLTLRASLSNSRDLFRLEYMASIFCQSRQPRCCEVIASHCVRSLRLLLWWLIESHLWMRRLDRKRCPPLAKSCPHWLWAVSQRTHFYRRCCAQKTDYDRYGGVRCFECQPTFPGSEKMVALGLYLFRWCPKGLDEPPPRWFLPRLLLLPRRRRRIPDLAATQFG